MSHIYAITTNTTSSSFLTLCTYMLIQKQKGQLHIQRRYKDVTESQEESWPKQTTKLQLISIITQKRVENRG